MEQTNIADFDFELELDEKQFELRAETEGTADQHMQMLRDYPNRLRISAVKMTGHGETGDGKFLTEVSFNLIANPHPKCDFEYICVYVNLSSWREVRIADIFPKEIKGTEPVKYNTKYGGGLGLKIDKVEIGPLFSAEKSTENNVYFIKLRGTGIDDSVADWIFEKEPNTRLYFNNLLTLLAEHERIAPTVTPLFSVEARIRLEGWKGAIPVYGSKRIAL
jgi:hypothetical protein